MDREMEFQLYSAIRCYCVQTLMYEAPGLAEGTLRCSSIKVIYEVKWY